MVELLKGAMVPELMKDKGAIALCSPVNKGKAQMTLHLYHVESCGEYRISTMRDLANGDRKYPPMTLNLYYLLSAYSSASESARSAEEHRLIGRAMQVLFDNPVLKDDLLKGTLSGSDQEIRVEMVSLKNAELMDIWRFDTMPYHLSVAYRLSPVLIESTRVKEVKRVAKSEFKFEEKHVKR